MRREGVEVRGALRARLLSGGKSNLTFDVRDDASHWVLRRPPTAGLTPSAHDMAREFRVTRGLYETAVPVARAVALCEDDAVMGAPFAVTEYVSGPVVRMKQDLEAFGDAELDGVVDELVRVLAELHAVDYAACGLGEFGRPDGYVTRQVALWAKQWERVKADDLPDIDRLHMLLAESIPQQSASSIVHGDYRIDNTILDGDGSVAAVVDWELSTLGDPLTDVALMCVYRDPALDLVLGEPAAWTSERLPSPDDLAERYSRASGRTLDNWQFYLGLAHFKMAVIAMGIDHRYRAGATVGSGFDTAGSAVPEFAARGLAALRSVSS
nr:phosphotransferase family protein [Rhodococcus sp. HNM0569]